jgi:hypothetical protein
VLSFPAVGLLLYALTAAERWALTDPSGDTPPRDRRGAPSAHPDEITTGVITGAGPLMRSGQRDGRHVELAMAPRLARSRPGRQGRRSRDRVSPGTFGRPVGAVCPWQVCACRQ